MALAAAAGAAAPSAQSAPGALDDVPAFPYEHVRNVRDWVAPSDYEILFETMDGRWYRATFTSPCLTMPDASMVDIVTGPEGRLDRNSSIEVDGQRCAFASFSETENPHHNSGQ
jgi:hypothetical protein